MSKPRYSVFIERPMDHFVIRVYVVENSEPPAYIEALGNDSYRRTVKDQEPIKPFFSVGMANDGMILALSEALNQFLGKPDETFVRGKLEATEQHLADMRDLVLKKVPK